MSAANSVNLELAFFVGIFTGFGSWIISYLITVGVSKMRNLNYEFNPMVWLPIFSGAMPMCICATLIFLLIAFVSPSPVLVMALTTFVAMILGILLPLAFLRTKQEKVNNLGAENGQIILSVFVLNIVVGLMSFGTSLFWVR